MSLLPLRFESLQSPGALPVALLLRLSGGCLTLLTSREGGLRQHEATG